MNRKQYIKDYQKKNEKQLKEYSKNWYLKNQKRKLEYQAQYRKEHPEKIINWKRENKEYIKKYDSVRSPIYYQKNKEKIIQNVKRYSKQNRLKINLRQNNRKKIDNNYKTACNLRTRLCNATKGNQKKGSAVRDLGCSIEDFKKYIESKFQEGMTWENWGRDTWHIDHIKPLAGFDLTNRTQLLEACHYTNLQPMWANDNWSKH